MPLNEVLFLASLTLARPVSSRFLFRYIKRICLAAFLSLCFAIKSLTMEIGEKIKVLRKKNRLTQAQLADLIGVSCQAEAKWESGASTPGILKIRDLAKALDTTSDVLLSPDPLNADNGRMTIGFLNETLTLKVPEGDIPAVNALLFSLGYVCASPEGEGSLLILDPISFFAAKKRNFFRLGFGLEPAELVNVEHEKYRSSLIYGAKVEAAFQEALDAEKSINPSRHLARGVVYLCFAPLSLTVLGFSIVLAENISPFYLILAFAMFLFTVLFIVQGVLWVKKPKSGDHSQEKAKYQFALDQLLSYATKDNALRNTALSSHARKG